MADLVETIKTSAPDHAERLLELRDRILGVAQDIGVGPIEQTLK